MGYVTNKKLDTSSGDALARSLAKAAAAERKRQEAICAANASGWCLFTLLFLPFAVMWALLKKAFDH